MRLLHNGLSNSLNCTGGWTAGEIIELWGVGELAYTLKGYVLNIEGASLWQGLAEYSCGSLLVKSRCHVQVPDYAD